MQIDVTSSTSARRRDPARRVSLTKAPIPSAGSPPGVRAALAQACRSAALSRQGEGDRLASPGKDGAWVLVGLGQGAVLDRAAAPGVREPPRRPCVPARPEVAFVFGKGIAEAEIRCVLPQLAASRLPVRPLPVARPADGARDPMARRPGRGRTQPSRTRLSRRGAEAGIVAQAAAWARDLGNTPANDLGPVEFAAAGAGDGPPARPLGARLRQEAHREGAPGGSPRRQLGKRAARRAS